jgi:hypothetical protein
VARALCRKVSDAVGVCWQRRFEEEEQGGLLGGVEQTPCASVQSRNGVA